MKYLAILHGVNEGELEIELSATTPALYSTVKGGVKDGTHQQTGESYVD